MEYGLIEFMNSEKVDNKLSNKRDIEIAQDIYAVGTPTATVCPDGQDSRKAQLPCR